MPVTLRAWRGGRKKRPYYRIVAIDKRRRRDSRYLAKIGHYHPLSNAEKNYSLDLDAAREWLNKGAEVSNLVGQLLKKEGVLREFATTKKNKRRKSRMNPISARAKLKQELELKKKEGEKRRQAALAKRKEEATEEPKTEEPKKDESKEAPKVEATETPKKDESKKAPQDEASKT